jgi:adenosylmethionine-8-amino-7-oxononanoate aminotransferase
MRTTAESDRTAHTRQVQDADRRFVWHPFTQHSLWNQTPPMVIERGEREFLFDSAGNRYIDATSSIWCNIHGHCHPTINAALVAQLDKIAHSTLLGLTGEPAVRLAERLVDITPDGLSKVFFSDNGSTAVEVACKMAYAYWHHRGQPERGSFVALRNAYHGDTIGAVSVGGIDLFHEVYRPLLFPTHFAPSPYCYRCELNKEPATCGLACADAVGDLLTQHDGKVAAVIVEPLMQCAAGMIAAPPGHLKRLRELCDRHDVLLIADEVATGFGRTGAMFACEHEQVVPDFLCLSKGLTGGYLPLAATLTRDAIYEAFLGPVDAGRTFYHGHTYTGNALGCAVALASLDVFTQEQTLTKLDEKVRRLFDHLARLARRDEVGDVRQHGLIAGIEIVKHQATREAYRYGDQIGMRICAAAREHGVLIRPLADVIVVFPPLSISLESLDTLMTVIDTCIDEVLREGRPGVVDGLE